MTWSKEVLLLSVLMVLSFLLTAVSCACPETRPTPVPSPTPTPTPTAPPIPQGVYIGLSSQEAKPGQEVSIKVEVIPKDSEISGGEINFQFDPSAVRVIEIEAGDSLGTSPIVGVEEVNNKGGTVKYALARKGTTTVPTPLGTFAIIKLKVLDTAKSGIYDLTLSRVGFCDQEFRDMADIDVQSAVLEITP